MTEKPIVLYTAIAGGYDTLKQVPTTLGADVDQVAFVDKNIAQINNWRCLPVHSKLADHNRNAKIHKILPHRYFPKAEYSLWIDGSVLIWFKYPMSNLIDKYLNKSDMAVFAHPLRNCLYQEACTCLHLNLDKPDTIRNHIYKYTKEGYPANNGLAECTVILRRHTKPVEDFCEAWWKEIQAGSRRDQLSFNYVVWKTGFTYQTFDGTLFYKGNNMFCRYRHRRRA